MTLNRVRYTNVLRDIRSLITVCVNLESLFLDCAGEESQHCAALLFGPFPDPYPHTHSSGAIPPPPPPLVFPFLRHLTLHFTLNRYVFDFLAIHRTQLRSVDLLHFDLYDYGREVGREICSLYPAEDPEATSMTQSGDRTSISSRTSLVLSPACRYLAIQPGFLPALLPFSQISDLHLREHERWFSLEIERVFEAISRTRGPGIKTLQFSSWSWTIPFLDRSAERIESVELVKIENVTLVSPRLGQNAADIFIVRSFPHPADLTPLQVEHATRVAPQNSRLKPVFLGYRPRSSTPCRISSRNSSTSRSSF